MEKTARNSFHYLLFFFLSYYFFLNRVVLTRLYTLYGSQSFYYIIAINLILPLLFFLKKPLNYVRKRTLTLLASKSYNMTLLFLVKLMTTAYLIFTSILTLQISSSVLITIYYNYFPLLILILTILISVYYVSRKGIVASNSVSIIIFSFLIIINILYILTGPKIRTFNYMVEASKTIETIKIIIMMMFYIFEFALLFLLSDNITSPIRGKTLFIFIATFSAISIYEAMILTGTFGNLLKMIPYPYYESWKIAGSEGTFENLGFLAFLYVYFLCFQRLSFSTSIFNKMWANTSKVITIIFLLLIGFGTYLITKYYAIYIDVVDDLFDCSLLLILVVSLLLFIIIKKGRQRENEGLRSTIN